MKPKDRWPWQVLWDGLNNAQCPKCKYYGGKEKSRKEIESHDHDENEDIPVKNAKGETIGTTRALVKKRTVTYQVYYRCYFEGCYHEWDAVEKKTRTL